MDEAVAIDDFHLDILQRKHSKAKAMLTQVSQGHVTVFIGAIKLLCNTFFLQIWHPPHHNVNNVGPC